MQSLLNYTKINDYNHSLKSSVIFYIYNKNIDKGTYHKIHNMVRGHYKDSILKKNIYLSSNGLKRAATFQETQLNELIFKFETKSYVSYFNILEDNFSKFNIFSRRYIKDFVKKFINKQNLIVNLKKKQSSKIIKNSNFFKYYKTLNLNKLENSLLSFSKLIFIKNGYKRFYFMTDKGLIRRTHWQFVTRIMYAGLIKILTDDIKKLLKSLLKLNYLLLNFHSKLILTIKNSTLVKYNFFLYTNYWKFLTKQIVSYFTNTKIKFRRSNTFLYRYRWLHLNKIKLILNFFYFLNFKKIFGSNSKDTWIQGLFFNKSSYYSRFANKELQNLFSWNKIQSLTLHNRVLFFQTLFKFLQINAVNKLSILDVYSEKTPPNYIIYKSFLFNDFVKVNLLKYYPSFYNINFYIYDLFINKIVKSTNYYFQNERFYFFNVGLKWCYSIIKNNFKYIKKANYSYFLTRRSFDIAKKYINEKKLLNYRIFKYYWPTGFYIVRRFKYKFNELKFTRRTKYFAKNKVKWKLLKKKRNQNTTI